MQDYVYTQALVLKSRVSSKTGTDVTANLELYRGCFQPPPPPDLLVIYPWFSMGFSQNILKSTTIQPDMSMTWIWHKKSFSSHAIQNE